jgi:SsrA-binding protein
MSIVTNRKAFYEYHVLEEFEAGIVLLGSEVKSIREGNVTLTDSFIYLKSGEVWIKNFKVSRYKQTHL